jgi:hypothetical protein
MRGLPAIAVAAWLAACGSSSDRDIDAPPVDDAVCKANLESALDRTCTTPADCVLVESADCCGPVMLAIHTGTDAQFPASEHDYEVCLACPPLGCNHAPQDEAGHTPQGGQAIVADCVSSRCVAVVQ